MCSIACGNSRPDQVEEEGHLGQDTTTVTHALYQTEKESYVAQPAATNTLHQTEKESYVAQPAATHVLDEVEEEGHFDQSITTVTHALHQTEKES